LAYYITGGDMTAFARYVLENYDASDDYWILKNNGTIADDESADLHWEAVIKNKNGKQEYKTIWRAEEGMSKEESLVALLGGTGKVIQMLLDERIMFADVSAKGLGSLIISSFTDATTGELSIDYSKFTFEKDWYGIYQSFMKNENFLKKHLSGNVFAGNTNLLTRANGNESITHLLEYYSLLYYPLKEELGITDGSDPLEVLKNQVVSFTHPSLDRSITINAAIKDDLQKALDETIALGGTVPPIGYGGGLTIRFIDSPKELSLSNHSIGLAVDFDPENNGVYNISSYFLRDQDFNDFIYQEMQKSQRDVYGWEENQQLAELYREVSQALFPRDLYASNSMIGPLSYDEYIDELYRHQITNIRINFQQTSIAIPALSFSMEKIFVESMSKYFTWGGNWPEKKDYMHFEKKR
jgi:hypothetical protein